MVTYIGLFLLGTIAGLAISMITIDITMQRLLEYAVYRDRGKGR